MSDAVDIISRLDKVGTVGLVLIVLGLLYVLRAIVRGDFVTKREAEDLRARLAKAEDRNEKLEAQRDRAVEVSRATSATSAKVLQIHEE